MPLVRFGVKNEYGLGVKELYKDGVEAEDPKAVLDGVAVAGLLGLLRQLGDLSQFAAEVFHGLQEQVASTSSRSRKLVTRVQDIEVSLSSLEKAILSQTSHIHLAYTPGSEWHPRIRNEQNHFIYDDLPHFIMDSFEECREPPRLQLLDRFDTGGPGSCLKRYSDPSFFRRASASSEVPNKEKSQRERKTRKMKKRKSWQRSGQFQNHVPNMNDNGRDQFSSRTGQGLSTQSHTGSTFDITFRSDLQDQSDSVGSKEGSKFAECDSHPCTPVLSHKVQNTELISTLDGNMTGITKRAVVSNTEIQQSSPASEIMVPHSSNVTWDEKLEVMEHMGLNYESEEVEDDPAANSYVHDDDVKPVTMESVDKVDLPEHENTPKADAPWQHPDATINLESAETEGVDYLLAQKVKNVDTQDDQLDEISEPGSSPKSDTDVHYSRTTRGLNFDEPVESSYLLVQEMKPVNADSTNQMEDLSEPGSSRELHANDEQTMTIRNGGILDYTVDEIQDLHETNIDLPGRDVMQHNAESLSQAIDLSEDEGTLKLIAEGSFVSPSDGKLSSGKVQYLLDTHDYVEWEVEGNDAHHVCSSFPEVASLSKGEITSEVTTDGYFVSDPSDSQLITSDVQYMLDMNLDNAMLEAVTLDADHFGNVDTSPEDGNNVNAIEWHHHDDIDSETDNFVDALYTIDSESESDQENQTKKVALLASNYELAEKTGSDLIADGVIHLEPERECHSRSGDNRDGVYDESEQPTSSASLSIVESLEKAQPSSNQSQAVTGKTQNGPLHFSHEQSVLNDSSSLPYGSEDIGFCADADEPGLQPAASDIAASSSEPSPYDATACTPHPSQEMPFGSTSSFPHALWTNGTLLGLQPLKPTVFSVSNSVCSAPEPVGPAELPSSSIKVSQACDNFHSDDQDIGSVKQTPYISEKTSKKMLDRDESKLSNHTVLHGLGNGHAALHESDVPAVADLRETVSEATNTNEDRSSILSLLGRGLKSGLSRNGSLGYGEKSKASNPTTSRDSENLCDAILSDPLSETSVNGELHSPVNSPPPSPPLEHMKISFRPINGFETSRLKLSYPEGIDHHEGTVDMFPSFQLVPEATRLQQDMVSESDDDTFCRSYPCLSDDGVNDLSDSDSEQWESEDTSGSNDHAYYEGLRRKSSTESGSSSPEHYKDQGSAVHSVAGPTSQLPSLQTRKQFAYGEMKACLNPEDSSYLQGLMPQPPPLPPLMWRVPKPTQEASEDKTEPGPYLNQSFKSTLSESPISHPASLDSAKLRSTMPESEITALQNKLDELKVNNPKVDYHATNGRTVDDREDFLYQIRTKSFNLKRTEAARSFSTPGPAAGNQVSAILQKANAIRQAVGSDGEDDSWSDT